MDRCISAGISGALLSAFISLFSPVYLYFIPSFVAAVLFIYASRLQTTREGLVTSLMTSVLGDGIFNTINNGAYFFSTSEPYALTVDIWVVLTPAISAFFALLAGYVGVRLASRLKPTREMPPSLPPPLPPV